MNVFIYYKTRTIHLDNIVAIIFQKTINLLCRGKRLQLPQYVKRLRKLLSSLTHIFFFFFITS